MGLGIIGWIVIGVVAGWLAERSWVVITAC